MAKGLPKWAIKEARARGAKNVFAYAWTLVKRKGKKGSRKSNPGKIKRRGGRKMARKKKRRSRSLTIPLAPIAGLACGVMDAWTRGGGFGNLHEVGYKLVENYTGYNPVRGNFDVNRLSKGLLPLILGAVVHKFVGGYPLNINKMLAQHKIPLIRI